MHRECGRTQILHGCDRLTARSRDVSSQDVLYGKLVLGSGGERLCGTFCCGSDVTQVCAVTGVIWNAAARRIGPGKRLACMTSSWNKTGLISRNSGAWSWFRPILPYRFDALTVGGIHAGDCPCPRHYQLYRHFGNPVAAAALLSGFISVYAGVMATGFAATLPILSAMLDRQKQSSSRHSSAGDHGP
jgi:hypothetical protein